MLYLSKQKFNLREVWDSQKERKKIFLHEPEYFIRGIYEKYLDSEGYEVESYENLPELSEKLVILNPDLLIISSYGYNPNVFLKTLGYLRKTYAGLPLLTIGQDLPHQTLADILSLGVTSHIDRKYNRPKDLVLLVNSLLKI